MMIPRQLSVSRGTYDYVHQPRLYENFDRPIGIPASRVFIGDFFEECTAKVFDAKRLKCVSQVDVCPDLITRDGVYIECKSIGRNKASIGYECRLVKMRDFLNQGNTGVFVLWNHTYQIKEGTPVEQLRRDLAKSIVSVTVLDAGSYIEKMFEQPCRVLNRKHTSSGYGAYGYNNGYRCRLKVLQELCHIGIDLSPSLLLFGQVTPLEFPVLADEASSKRFRILGAELKLTCKDQ